MTGLRGLTWAAVVMGVLLTGAAAEAIDFNFATDLGGGVNNTQLTASETTNTITADGFDNIDATTDPIDLSSGNSELLWLRNQPNDHGLGVCNNLGGTGTCISGGGDENELDNGDSSEGIRLTKEGGTWTSLWVSSLDGNKGTGSETGTLLWSDDPNQFSVSNSFTFSFADIALSGQTGVEVDLFTLNGFAGSGFNASAPYLLFIAGTPGGGEGNNDYLVWKGSVDVPEPGTLALLGAGLVGMAVAARRWRRG